LNIFLKALFDFAKIAQFCPVNYLTTQKRKRKVKFRMVLNTVGFFAGVSFFYAFTYFFVRVLLAKLSFAFGWSKVLLNNVLQILL
jgi:hypothetical protein